MTIHVPKGGRSIHVEAKQQAATVTATPAAAAGESSVPLKQGDGMLPDAVPAPRERYTQPQGNSLIERTQRYLGQQLAKTESNLAPLIGQLQANGWFSAQTLAALGRAETKEQIASLIRDDPGAALLGKGADLGRLSEELLKSPASAASVLLLSTSGAAIDERGGPLAAAAQSDLRKLIDLTRHLDNLGTWVDKGYTRYASLEQMRTELESAQASAVKQLWAAVSPVTLADITAAQKAWESAGAAPTRDARKAAQGEVLDAFEKTMSKLPAPLWSELVGQDADVRGRLEMLLERGPHGSDFERARNVVSLFLTNGQQGAGLHAMFEQGINLEYFMRGGYIPDTVGRGADLWT